MDHSGHSMSNVGSLSVFRIRNKSLARAYWYIIAGVIFLLLLIRVYRRYEFMTRLVFCHSRFVSHAHVILRFRRARSRSSQWPSRTAGGISCAFATATAIVREISYPQAVVRKSGLTWLSPPSLGRAWVLLTYWAVIIYMLVWKSISHDSYYYERMAFRAAWVSITQIPLIFLLSTKSSFVGLIIGSSHERLNWLHRWVARTLLVTASIHGGFFFNEWVKADFVSFQFKYMPMVRYGVSAWFVLLWMNISSILPIRRFAYELFILQHLGTAGVLLWLLWIHIPDYAMYNIYFAIATLSADRVLRWARLCWRNVRLRVQGPTCKGMQHLGHIAQLQSICDEITVVTIRDVNMSWRAGQHVYLWLPLLGPWEMHPFTIASPYNSPNNCPCSDIQLAIRTQKGFTRRIHKRAKTREAQRQPFITRAFVSGPYGHPPEWNAYETLVLISASTGASFTLPVMECVLSSPRTSCVRRIVFVLCARDIMHVQWYVERLQLALEKASARGIELDVQVAITGDALTDESPRERSSSNSSSDAESVEKGPLASENTASKTSLKESAGEKASCCQRPVARITSMECGPGSNDLPTSTTSGACCSTAVSACHCSNAAPPAPMAVSSHAITYTRSRPAIPSIIRAAVESTGGESMIAVCGGRSLVASTRNTVARLSDERAVHKGTGAQGIACWVEEYSY